MSVVSFKLIVSSKVGYREQASSDFMRPVLALFFSCVMVVAMAQPTAKEWNQGVIGWNLGNQFECSAPGQDGESMQIGMADNSIKAETAWGNPVVTKKMIKAVKEAGFNAIRVPVTWYPHMEAKFQLNGTAWDKEKDDLGTKIQAAWMKRVHEVVDYVISQDMYCILNIHHDTGAASTAWLIADESVYAQEHERFEAVWKQIAEEFKDYGDHLLFEGYNEMLDKKQSWCFASFGANGGYDATIAKSAYNAINSYAQTFVNTVRSTGGNNAQRNLIVSTYGACSGSGTWNSHLQDPLKQMKLPNDNVSNHLIFEVHTYLDIKTINNAKNEVNQMIRDIKSHLVSKGVPVIFGEWGTSTDNGYESYRNNMLTFARYFVEKAKAAGMGTFYWMGLSDGKSRSIPEFNQPDLVEALVKGYYGEEGYQSVISPTVLPVSDNIYDLQGCRLPAIPEKGIYLHGGKKYVR